MKKLNYVSALLCAAALTGSCSNEEWVESGIATQGEMSLIATTGADTRTAVDENYNVNWSSTDVFYAFGGSTGTDKVYNATAKFEYKSGTGTTGTFEGTLTGVKSDLEYAVYPLSAYTPETQAVTFPAAYTYPNSNAPMFGTLNAEKTQVNFNQLLSGLLRIKMTGIATGKSGTLKLNATGITGKTELTIANGAATLGTLTDTGNEVTLTFETDKDPMILDIPVPAGTYADGITATLTIGTAEASVFHTTKSFVIKAGTAKVMPAISVVEIDGTTIKFSQVVEDVAAAKKALENGVKSVTIENVKTGEAIAIPSTITSTEEEPVTINISSVEENAAITVTGTDTNSGAVVINVPQGSKGTLTVDKIAHAEISGGTWAKVTATTGDNTLEIQSGTVIEELIVKGGIRIAADAEVKKMTLSGNASIKNNLNIAASKSMEINVGTHTLTLAGTGDRLIDGGGKLTLTGDESNKGTITDMGNGIFLNENGAQFSMKNINYSANKEGSFGLVIPKHISNTTITIEGCTMNGKYYCISTNALNDVGSNNTITLTNSEFTAEETALLFNINSTLTATGCTFTGGWQGAILRGYKCTFDKCGFNLNANSKYGVSGNAAGSTSWGDGNNVPSAAITIGNRGGNTTYNYTKDVELKNSCTFSVKKDNADTKDYPAVYIDANPNQTSQTVVFKYDDSSKTAFEAAGKGLVINNTTGQVSLNGTVYNGPTQQ